MPSLRTMINDFRFDPVFVGLKRAASSGRGEHGPLFDKGVLSVIEQIETTGSFEPNPIKLLAGVPLLRKFNALKADELVNAEQMAQRNGWSIEEASQYAAGVNTAESNLSAYGRRSAKQEEI